MMRRDGLLSPRGLMAAAVLALAGLGLAWLCFRAALVRTLPATSPLAMQLAPDDPPGVLARATALVAKPNARIDAATLDQVRRAASVVPLDARTFLLIGRQQLLEGKPDQAVRTLEAGQRLDPRNRLIHVLLLERYLRTRRYAQASAQFATLARLVGRTGPTVATAMGQMAMAPDMRDATRHTLASDPVLEQTVLVALARGNTEPDAIFSLASATARAHAGDKESWGPPLVERLVAAGRFDVARAVWRRVYHITDAAAAEPIFNSAFATTNASPPFAWTLTADGTGAADPRGGALSIDYYGRDNGDLASQLLVLKPGSYQFSYTADGGKADAAKLFWTLTCSSAGKQVLMNADVPMAAGARRAGANLIVPSDCPAQMLTLRGEAGEFPSPVNMTIGGLALRRVGEARP